MIGDISFTYVRGHVPMIGGHQLYLCEGDMYE